MKINLKGLFKSKKRAAEPITENKNSLIVSEIAETSESFNEALGVTAERAEYLMNKAKEINEDCNRISELLAKMSHEVIHANELAYVCFNLGKHHKANGGDIDPIELLKLLKGFQ